MILNLLKSKNISKEYFLDVLETDLLKKEKLKKELFVEGRRPYKTTMKKIIAVLNVDENIFKTKFSKNLEILIIKKEGSLKTGINNIAFLTGISKASLRAYLDSEREPTLRVLEKLSYYFSIKIDDMLNNIEFIDKGLSVDENKEVTELISKISGFSENQKRYLKEILKML